MREEQGSEDTVAGKGAAVEEGTGGNLSHAGDEGDEAAAGGNSSEEADRDQKRRVYVGNLAWEVSWQDLKDLMKTLDHEVVRVDVLQTSDGRSKGCGIVEFATPEGAAEAVLTLNDTELSGRRIFVREDREQASGRETGHNNYPYSSSRAGGRYGNPRSRYGGPAIHHGNHQGVSSDPGSQSRRVYVGNLSWDVAWADLKDHMKQAGEVVRADVICEHNGRSKGCGIVEFETEEGARNAIATLTHSELLGRTIFVREDREGSGSEAKGGQRPKRNGPGAFHQSSNKSVYVWNLSYDVSWQDLKDHMRRAGNVDQATILTGSDGSTSIGCGIVVYQSARDAARAIRELQESDLKGRPVRLREDKIAGRGPRPARGPRSGSDEPRAPPGVVTQLYVGNLSYDTTWRELKEHFLQAGEVVRADVKASDSGRSKGFGIVRFASPEDAQNAIATLAGTELDGRPIEVRPDHRA